MKALVTGFAPFASLAENPSELVVDELNRKADCLGAACRLSTRVLPVEFSRAGREIGGLIGEIEPDVLLMMGYAARAGRVQLERIALNVADSSRPDNAAFCPSGEALVADGPLAYRASIPVELLKAKLEDEGIPAAISNHAGTFVCNCAFYRAMNTIERSNMQVICGFIHIPMLAAVGARKRQEALTVEDVARAVLICLRGCIDYLQTRPIQPS